jgi:hypothetical protein
MEYLMTYGWAILIIAVVLGALFSLGVFNGGGTLGTACIGSSGFLCTGLSYSHTSGNLIVTIGQSTGSNWGSTSSNNFIVFVPQGTSTATGGIPIVAAANVAVLGTVDTAFTSGSSQTGVNLPASAANTVIGSTVSGAIWVCAGSTSNALTAFNALAGCSYYQVATITAKAS